MSFDEEWRAIAKSDDGLQKKKKNSSENFHDPQQFFSKIFQDPFKTPIFKLRHLGYNFPKIHRISEFFKRFKRYEKILN